MSSDGRERTHVCLSGGLGNQLFQLAAGLYAAPNSDVVLVTNIAVARSHDGSAPDISGLSLPEGVTVSTVRHTPGLRRLATKAAGYLLRRAARTSPTRWVDPLVPALGSLILSGDQRRMVRIVSPPSAGFANLRRGETGPRLLVGYFQTWRYLDDEAVATRMSGMRCTIGSTWLDDCRTWAQQESPIIVHVRLTDYRRSRGIGLLGPAYFAAALTRIRSMGLEGRLWVFSDEPDAVRDWLPTDEVRRGPRYMCPPPEQAHPAVMLDAMTLGTAYALSNSTFGWWGASLAAAGHPPVVVPQPWFRGYPDPADLIPPAWMAESRVDGSPGSRGDLQ